LARRKRKIAVGDASKRRVVAERRDNDSGRGGVPDDVADVVYAGNVLVVEDVGDLPIISTPIFSLIFTYLEIRRSMLMVRFMWNALRPTMSIPLRPFDPLIPDP